MKISLGLNYCVFGVAGVLTAGSFIWGEFGFAQGVLIGCSIAVLNFLLLQRVFGNFFTKKKINPTWIIIYILKLGITLGIIYVARKFFGADLYGLAIGLSPVFIGILIFSIFQTLR